MLSKGYLYQPEGFFMIFITGGAYQGKYSYARENYSKEYMIINAYQDIVRKQMLEGKNPINEAESLLNRCGSEAGDVSMDRLVIICDEVGGGIVPMDEFERDYRENVGRIACFFAGRAEKVLRIVCGIPVELK